MQQPLLLLIDFYYLPQLYLDAVAFAYFQQIKNYFFTSESMQFIAVRIFTVNGVIITVRPF